MKSRLARFLDTFFLAAVTWLLAAVIALYYVRELYLIILIATTATLAIVFLINLKRKKALEKEQTDYNAGLCAQHFVFHDDIYALDYFYNALRKRYDVSKNSFYLTINNTIIVPVATEALSLKKTVYFYSEALRKGAKTLVILSFKTEKFPVDPKEKLTDLRLEIFGADKTYRLLKSLNALPKEEKPIKINKLKSLLPLAFSKKRTKGYLGTAFVLLFGAYFSMFSIYYIAASAVCLTLALLCKLDIAEKLKNDKPEKPLTPSN